MDRSSSECKNMIEGDNWEYRKHNKRIMANTEEDRSQNERGVFILDSLWQPGNEEMDDWGEERKWWRQLSCSRSKISTGKACISHDLFVIVVLQAVKSTLLPVGATMSWRWRWMRKCMETRIPALVSALADICRVVYNRCLSWHSRVPAFLSPDGDRK